MSEDSCNEAIVSLMPSEKPRNGFGQRNVQELPLEYTRHIDRAETDMEKELKENISSPQESIDAVAPESEDEDEIDEISSFDEENLNNSQNSQSTDSQQKEEPSPLPLGNVVVAAANPKTIKTYQSHVRVFKDWLRSEGLPPDFEYCSAAELSSWLLKFYRDGRRKDGGEWKPSSLKIIRFAINQHLKNEPFNRNISITRDEQFREANNIISARQKELQQLGLDATGTRESKESAKPLTSEDIRQLWARGVIGISSPKALHRFAFMIVAVNFGITARIGLHLLRPSMFRFGVDENSMLPYAQYNPKGENTPNPKKATKANRKMFGIPGSQQCPVTALKLYIQKMKAEGTEAFFHTPNRHFKETGVWYTPQPTGKNTLGRLMKDIATEGKLSFPYTNHSLRYTSPFVFFQAVQGGCNVPDAAAYRSEDGNVKYYNSKQLPPLQNISPRPFSRVPSRPPALRKIETATNGDSAADRQCVPLSVTQSSNGSIVVHHKPSSLVALPVTSSMPSVAPVSPPLKRRRVFSTPQSEDPFRFSTPSLTSTPMNGAHIGPLSRNARFAQDMESRSTTPSAIKAHHVLCVPQKWEMTDIMRVLNSGDAIILSRHNLREKRVMQSEQVIKREETGQSERSMDVSHEAAAKKYSAVTAADGYARVAPQEAREYNGDAERECLSPAVSGMPSSSRASRKQTVPKKLVKLEDELITEQDDEIESTIAYDEAIQTINSKLTIIEHLHKNFLPTRDHMKRLDELKDRVDRVVAQAAVQQSKVPLHMHEGEDEHDHAEDARANGFTHI